MDFVVSATVDLTVFHDETKVRELFRLYDFVTTDQSRGQLFVKGSFLKLKAVKAHLEKLNTQIQTMPQIQTRPPLRSSPQVQAVSSGAISKSYTNKSSPRSGGNTGRFGSGADLLHDSSPSSNTRDSTSSDQRTSFSPGAVQRSSVRRESPELFVVDADVYRYAAQIKQNDIDSILENHKVHIVVREIADNVIITLQGRNAKMATTELQKLMKGLNSSLRTQEVLLKDMSHGGKGLLKTIKKNKNVAQDSVLVCEMSDRLRLIGPSSESYEVKQELLGRPVQQSQRAGRTLEKKSRLRSRSLPPINRKNNEREGGAFAQPSPVGAVGYSPSQEVVRVGQEAGARPGQSVALRRSCSETRGRRREEKTYDIVQQKENKHNTPKFKALLVLKDVKQKFKSLRK